MDSNKILLVGLGNPGSKYQKNRHNAGFLFLDFFKEEYFLNEKWKEKYHGLTITTYFQLENLNIPLILLKPQTYMNLSGNSVKDCIDKEKISIRNIVVIHDEIELPFGEVKTKVGGGHRGHNGLRDIIQKCGSDFFRIRIGVGRPNDSMSVADYVLSNFSKEEFEKWENIYQNAKKLLLENIFISSCKFM